MKKLLTIALLFSFSALVAQADFTDTDEHRYQEAIAFVEEAGIVEGYEDGSFQPDEPINRAELLKIIVEAVYEDEFEAHAEADCFSDVSAGSWYTPYVCFAKEEGIVKGYEDNSFQPAQNVSYVEALKMSMIGFGYDYVEGDPWYQPTLDTALEHEFVANDITAAGMELTRAQMAELITRIVKYNEGELEGYLEAYLPVYDIYGELETYEEYVENMVYLVNAHRINHGLWALEMDENLNAVAQSHSEWMYDAVTLNHEDADGNRAQDRCAAAGTECTGENIAFSAIHNAAFVFDVWKGSEGHNENMLGAYTAIGVGSRGDYFTQVFR